ncbi:MAG TPA: alkaline phosphatase D family protein [Candidatus Binatia bacterium]|nr:alkaline phosphatase D family protein [Candidatus Binatia bacterium]
MHVRYKKAGVSSYDNSVTTNTLSSSDNTGVITISGLEANTTYDYRLVVNGTELASTASTFKTLPSTGQASSFSFTFGADVSYTRRPHTIFSAMNSKNPDFNLLIGDIMYSDSPTVSTTLSQYRTKYKENYSDSHLNSFMKTTPSLFMWDDHEIRNDWSSGKSGIYPIARQAFNEYVAAINPTPRVSGELYYSFNVGQASFYVMDPRSYRSANTATDNSSKTMLGATQKADFKNWLLNSNAKFKVIVSSVPFSDFGTTANDSWFGFKTERKEITDFISANNIKGVLLLVGDQHWSMVTRLDSLTNGSNLYEFMPTPLNTVMRTPTSSTDPRILFKQGNVHNYGHFSINTTVTPATLTYTNYDGNNNVLYRLTITEKNINP